MRSSPKLTSALTGEYISPVGYITSRGRGEVKAEVLQDWPTTEFEIKGRVLPLITHAASLSHSFQAIESCLVWLSSRLEEMSELEAEGCWNEFAESISFNGSLGQLVSGVLEARSAVCWGVNQLNKYPIYNAPTLVVRLNRAADEVAVFADKLEEAAQEISTS